MGMMRKIRLFSIFSLLLSFWQILYLEVKDRNNHGLIGTEAGRRTSNIPTSLQDFQQDIRNRKLKKKEMKQTAEQKSGNYESSSRIVERRQNRKRLLVRNRADTIAQNENIFKTSSVATDSSKRMMWSSEDIESQQQQMLPEVQQQQPYQQQYVSWMDNRSNALPEFHEGGSILLMPQENVQQQTRFKGIRPARRRSIVFVHLGKASGRTIQQTFKAGCYAFQGPRRRRSCLARLQQINSINETGETMLSQSVKTRIHCDRIGPIKDISTATTFLFSTRDPVDRIVSWYDYTNPANCQDKEVMAVNCQIDRYYHEGWVYDFFKRCFTTATSFVDSLKDPNWRSNIETTTGIPCSKLAWMGILSMAPPDQSSHLYFNYNFYQNATINKYSEKEVMVVRTEYLWDDLTAVESYLGGNTIIDGAIYGSIDGTHGSYSYEHRTNLNPQSEQILCCAIQDEIQIYVSWIQQALNLNATTKEESIRSLATKCSVMDLGMLKTTCDGIMGRSFELLQSLRREDGRDEKGGVGEGAQG